jgi:hypothetical protein
MNALIDIAIGSGAVGAGLGLFEAGLWLKTRRSETPAEHAELLPERAAVRSLRAAERVVERPGPAQPVDQGSGQEAPPARAGARR